MRRLSAAVLLAAGAAAPASALDVFHVGNSLTATATPRGIENIAKGAGYDHSHTIVSSAGASLNFNWPKTDNINPMSTQQWDAMTLQPFAKLDKEYRFADYYIKAMRGEAAIDQNDPPAMPPGASDPTGMSSDVIVYIYEQASPELISSGVVTEQPYNSDMNHYYWAYAEKMINDLSADNPGVTIRKIPASQAVYELNQRIMAGEVPGVSHLDQVFAGIHPNDVGGYILGLSFYASMYQTNPIGAPMPSQDYLVPDELILPFQEAVWTVVSRDPQVGIANSLVISSPSLPRGVEGVTYNAQLESKLADGAVTWSIADGTLPPGVTMTTSGAISGTPNTLGIFPITFRADDTGGNSDERRLFFFVDTDNPPVMDSTGFDAVPWGSYTEQRLEASSGVPPYSWEVTKHELPGGMELAADGLLRGAPLTPEGTYEFEIMLTDSNPVAPVSMLYDMTLSVVAPEVGTAITYKTDSTITVDGMANEAAWSLVGTANHVREPGSDNTATWGVLWNDQYLFFAVDVVDPDIVSDSTDILEDDAVQIFIDAFHDRESVFNADDRQIVVTADGRFAELNDRPSDILSAVSTTANGYQVEVAIPWTNMLLTPELIFSVGLDVGIVDDDNGGERDGYNVWLGGRDDAPVPTEFGNLVMATYGYANDIIKNGHFREPPDGDYGGPSPNEAYEAETISFPGEVSSAYLMSEWLVTSSWKATFFRFSRINSAKGVGLPGNAAWAFGDPDARTGALAQIIEDNKSTSGSGMLSFDLRNPADAVNLRLYGYNAPDHATLDSKLEARVRDQDPINGGSYDVQLLATDLGAVTLGLDDASDEYQSVNIPIDFGPGYDYILIGLSGPIADPDTLQTFIDNIRLGTLATGMEVYYGSPTDAVLSWSTITSETTEGQTEDALRFEVTRDVTDNFVHPFEISLIPTAAVSSADIVPTGPLTIPPREASVFVDIQAAVDTESEGDETATLELLPDGGDSTTATEASATIHDHPIQIGLDAAGGTFDGDNDGDNIPDIFEYLAGSDMNDASSKGTLNFVLTPTGNAVGVEGEITLATGSNNIADVYVDTSYDLINWTRYKVGSNAFPLTSTSTDAFGTVFKYSASDMADLSTEPAWFIRWSVEQK